MKEWILKTLFLALTSLALSSCGSDSTVSIDSEGALSSASLSLISGDGQFAAINTDYSDPLVVKVTGADDVSNIPIIFEITSGSGSLSQSTVNTDSDGQASVNIRSGSKAETIKVFAKMVLAGKSESLTFSLVVNGTSADWEITQVGGSSSVTAGSTFQIRLRALNTNGELDTDFNGAKDLAFTTDNGSAPNGTVASLPANGSYNFTNGVIDTDLDVVFYNSSESAAEKFSIQVSGSSLTAATMTAIEVTDAAPSTVKIVDTTDCSSASEIGDETYVVPTTQTLYSLYYDTYENCIEGIDADSNWTKAFLDSQVTYDTAISGVNTVDFTPVQGDISEATGFSITDTTYAYTDSTGTITLTSGAASQFLITGLDSSGNYTVDAGDTVEILVEARDVFGNLAEDYTGSKTLNFSTTATTTSPPTGTASAHSADIPANGGTYVFANGVLTSGDVDLTFYNSGDTPTVTVTDANDTTINGTSPSITVDTVAHTYTRVRSASNNGGSLTSGGTIDADDSLTFYCATYDTYGNYLTDDATADWTYSGDITAGELGGLTDSSSLSYDPSTIGNGSVTCTVGSISDNSGTYTINPGEPTTVAIADSGTTSFGSVFSETAGVNFAVALRVYDSDGNFADNFTDDIDLTLSYIGSVNVDSTIPSEITPSISTTLINSTASISEDLTVSFSSGDATVSNLRLLNEANTTDRVKVQLDDNDSTYSIATAQSGYVTVTTGSLAYISIRNAASNGGDMVNAPALDNDGNITLYAAGFDAAGNYISDQSVTWSTSAGTSSCTNGDLSSTSGSSITFSPSSTGTCTITADAGGGITDTTGAISSSNGTATSFSITLLGGGTTTTAGENFGLRITALDADGNRAFDYSPATTYTITSTLTNSPEGTAPDTWSVSSSDFVFGEAIIFPVKAYNAQTFTVTVTETVGGAGLASTSATLTNQANSLNHYATSSGSGTYTADGVTTFSFTVEARDEYGNATTTGITSNTVNAVTPVYSSGDEATVGSFSGFTSFTFGGGSATETISGLTYDISHEVEVVVSDSAGVTTKSGERLAIEFDPSPSSISSYEIFNISDTTPDAGDTITAQIRALDSAGNVVTDSTDESIDNALEGYTFTVTFGSSANNSDYGDSPTSSGLGSLTFTEGVSSTFNLAFYNDETVLGTDIDIDDGNSRVGDAGSNDITVSTASLDHYSNNATAPASIDGDGTSTFTATINARDAYGNIVTGDSSITLTPVAQDSHTVGILGGTKTLNMASGTTTVTDLTYNASGTLKLGSTGGTASIDTATAGRSTVYSFDSVAGTVDSYLVEILDGANPTAGDSTYRIRLTAKDSSDNTIDDDSVDATLSARTFTISGFSASPEGTAFSPAAGFVWSSEVTTGNESDFTDGVAVLEITPVAAETITSFTVTDSSSISGTYSGSITIDPATFSKVVIAGASSGTADGNDASPTDYTATVTGRDTYGNVTTAPGATGYTALVLDTTRINGVGNTGTVSSTPATIDLTTNATTVVSVNYNVAHSTRFKFTDAGATALIDSSLTPIVTWSMDASVVNSYTLVPTSSTGTAGSDSTFRLTAFDAGGNQIVGEDTILDTISFDFSSSGTNCDAPNTSDSGYVAQLNGSDLSSANAVTATSLGGFSNGIIDFPVTFYNTQASCGAVGFLDFTDTTNSVAGSNGSAITIEAATKYYATTAVSGFPQNADDTRVNTTSLTITLYDEYGNEKEDSTESGTFLSLQKISGYGVSTGILKACGPTGGGAAANYGDTCITPIDVTTINLDFSSSATQTLYDLSYDVGHTIEVRYDNSSGVTTQASIAADAENFSFTTTTGTVVSYTFVNPTGPITSGTSDTWTITALDSAGNTITGSDSVLDTLSLSITDNTAGDFDAPDGGDSLQISIGGFSTGEADATITIYSSEDVENSDFTLVDSTNTINTNNTGGTVTVNSVGDCDRFTAETTNLGSSPDADGVRLNSTEVLLTCVDAYGNATSYAGGNNIKVDFVHVSDAQAYGANTGTLKACSPSAGNGCGTPVDVTTLTLDFSSPTTTQTLYDLSYDVGHDIYVRAYEDGGSVTTASGDSDLIEWEAVAGTIASYTLTPVSGSTNAGNVTSWEIRAFDIASNQMTNENGLNDTILSARSYSVVETAAGSGNMDGPTSGTVDLPSGASVTFSSGVATLSGADGLTFYNSDNDVPTNYLELQDDLSNTGTLPSGMTIDPEGIGASFGVSTTGTFPGDASNDNTTDGDTEITITLYDQYGNATTDSTVTNATITPSITTSDANYTTLGNLEACGPDSADANNGDGCSTPLVYTSLSYDFTSSTTQVLSDLSYTAPHDIQFFLSSTARSGISTASGDSDSIQWSAGSKVIDSYTLTFDSLNATAGASTNLTLSAYDAAGNLVDQAGEDSTLDAITFNFTATAANDAPTSADTVADNDPADGSSFNFSSGQATVPYIFFADRVVLGTADEITITDNNGVSVTPDNSDSIDVDPATATQLVFTTSALTETAGVCSGAVTIQTRDPYGNPSTVGSNLSVTLAGDSGTMSFFSDSGCSSSIGTTATVTSGTHTSTFYYTDTSEGTTNISLSSSLTDPSDQAHTIQANTAVQIAFTTSAQTVAAGDCSAVVTVEARDTYGNDSEVGSNTNITLAGDSGTMTFFSDSGCSTGIGTTATITSGTDEVSFYYKDTSEGTTNLSLSSSLTDPSDQAQTIQANTAVQLAFTTSAQTVTAGDCSGVVTVESQDTHGNDSEVGSNTNITLAGDSGTMTFFSDSGCSTGIGTTATITSGTDEVSFYYKDTSEGTTNLSLSSSLTDPSNQAQTIQANTAVQIAFTTSAQTVAAGDCSGVVTVESQDTHGNDSEVGSNTNITLAGDSGTMSFFSDSGCSTGIGTTATITSGTDEVSFYYKDTSEGTTNVSLSSSLTDPSDQAQTIQANTAVTLVLLTSGHTVAAGDCSAVVTLEARDTHGNDSEVGSNTNITLAGDSGTMTFFSDSGCSTGIGTTATMTSGTDQVSFYYKDTSEGTTSLSFSSSLTDPSAQNQTIQANAATQLAFTTSAQTVAAGDCSGVVTVESQDTHGNDSEVGSNTSITLAGDSGTMTFFSDSGCSTGIGTTATITSGTDEVSFYYKDTSEGTTNLSLSSSLTDPSDQAQTIQANTAVQLAFTTSAQTIAAGDCSAVVTVEARDTHGNDSEVGSNTNITLAGDSGTMSFFSDSGCSTGIGTTATITSGTDEVSFYYKDTSEGTTNLSLSSSLTDPSDQAQTIQANTAVTLVLLTSGHTVAAGDCSAVVTLEARDTHGNDSEVGSNTNITLAGDSGTMTFFSDSGCSSSIGTAATMTSGTDQVSFYYKDTSEGTTSLSFSSSLTDPSAQNQTIQANTAVQLAFTTSAQTVTAGDCSGVVTVESQDTHGNDSEVGSNTNITLAGDSGTMSFFSDSGCSTGIGTTATITSGTDEVSFYYKDTSEGTTNLSLSSSLSDPSDQAQTIQANTAVTLVLLTSGHTVAAGDCSAVVTLEARDTHGNDSEVGSNTNITLAGDSGTMTFFSDSGCSTGIGTTATMTSGTDQVSFYYKDTSEGTTSLSFSSSLTDPSAQNQTIQANTAVQIAFTTSAQTLAAGDCSAVVTVEARDTHGNDSEVGSNTSITLAGDSGTMSFFSDSGCSTGIGTTATITSGTDEVSFYYKDTSEGTTNLSLSSSLTDPSDQAQTIQANTAVQIAFTTSAQTVAAGDCSGVVTVESQDTHGNDSEVGSNTNITLAGDSGTMSFFSDSGCSTGIGTTATITSGTDEVSFYYKDTSEGTTNLSLSSSLTDPSDQAQTIQANTAVTLVLLTSGHTVAAGDCSAVVTLEARDTHGNDSEVGSNTNITLAGDSGTMTFFSDSGCSSSIGTTATMTSGTDQVSFYYKDTSEGTTSLSFSSSLTDPSAQNQTIQANTATQLAFTTSAQTLAAGDCSGVVTVEARDTHGNDSEVGSNTNITLAGDSGTMSFFSDSGCSTGIGTTATITSGTDEVSFYYKDTSEGTTNLSLSSSLTDPSDQAQTIQANTAVQLAFTTSAQTIAAGDCSAVVTVEARDTHGNDSEVGSNTNITLAGDSGTMSFFSDSGCSTGIGTTATITSGTDEVSFYYKDTSEGTTDLSLSSSLTDPSDQAQTIQANTAVTLVLLTSGHTVAAGDCSAVVTLEARDTHGNDSEVGSNTNITLAGDSGTMSFFSDSGCSSSIGTTATMTSGTDQVSFYYKDTSEGTTSLSFSSSLTDPSAQNQTIQANTAAQLAFTTSAQTVTAGDCSGVVTVESQDTHGNDSEVGSNTNITLAGDSGTMSFFSDSGCSTGIGTTATITSGTDEVSFYYKDTSEGTTNLSLTSSLTDPSDQAQTIQANTAVTLVLLTSAQTLTAGDCSAVVTLEARDTHGNDADVGSNTNITLAGDSGTMSFFSDSGCSTGIGTTATITSGTDEVSFYFKDTTDGTTNLSFSSALTDPSDQAQTINHGAVAALNWDTEIVANEITNTNFTTAGVISAEDAHGNPIVDTNETIVVSYSSNSDCSSDSTANLSNNSGTTSSGSLTLSTVQSSASGGPYYFKAYVSGSPGISACTSGTSSIYDPISISPASPTVSALGTQTFVITGGVPAITCNDIVTNNSGGSVTSSCYTAACAGDYCIDYTAGVQGSNTDTVRTTDFKGNSADATITVNGGQFNASSASYSFPGGTCTGGGTSTTITVANDGNVHATSVSESLSGDAELTYNASSTCGISDTDLNTGGADTCDIIIDFDGSSGSHSATVTIQDTTNGGSTTVSFDATCP